MVMNKDISLKKLYVSFTFALILVLFNCTAIAKTATIMLSIDGFSAHYLNTYKPKNLQYLASKGVSSEGLVPSFPTKTFPNHLTLVTGKAPFEHGIVLNKFYDKKADDSYAYGKSKTAHQWLKYPPIWTLLEQTNVPTAIYFWPESEHSYQGVLPSYYKKYNDHTPNKQRFNQMLKWLKMSGGSKPQLILGYFSSIDSAGHHYGRNSPELADAIYSLDNQLGEFIKQIAALKNTAVNLILVSDHGMVKIDKKKIILTTQIIPQWIFDNFKVVSDSTQIFIYGDDSALLAKAYQSLKVKEIENSKTNKQQYDIFNKTNYPAYWKVSPEKSFTPDIILSARPPAAFSKTLNSTLVETHGYEAKYSTDLNGLFIAYGPDFKQSTQVKPFSNSYVFSMLSHLFTLDTGTPTKKQANILNSVLNAN